MSVDSDLFDEYRASCASKKRYHSVEMAGRAADSAHSQGSRDRLRIYSCPVCGGYHLTSKALEDFAGTT